jgi:nitrate/nitrite transporter NarK
MDLMLPAAWAVCLDVGKRHAGVVTGLMNTAGQFSGFVCAILFGYVVRATGSYNAPLWIISAMILVSAGLFALIDPTRALVSERSRFRSGLESLDATEKHRTKEILATDLSALQDEFQP